MKKRATSAAVSAAMGTEVTISTSITSPRKLRKLGAIDPDADVPELDFPAWS